MKRTRSAELLYRLSRWRDLYLDLARQPWITLEREIDIEEARKMFPTADRLWRNSVRTKIEVYAPMKVEVEP